MNLCSQYLRRLKGTVVIMTILCSSLIVGLSFLVRPSWSPAPWWNDEWNFRESIDLNHTLVSAPLANFPVLIDLIDSNLASKAESNGNDIVFADSSSSKLNYEIEMFDSGSGHLVAWVEVPLLSNESDTVLYMYYGNPSAVSQQNATGVWDSNFVMVQHMKELSGTRYDSTNNGNNGGILPLHTDVGRDPAGKIDGAASLTTSSGYEEVSQGFLPNSAITVELWFKPSLYSTTSWTKFINTGPATTQGIFGSQTSLNPTAYGWTMGLSWNSGAISLNSYDIISNNVWKHVVLTWSGQLFTAYVNGVIVRQANVTGVPDWSGRPLFLGSSYAGTEHFSGSIDEVRISNIARTSDWIKTCFNNQNNARSFCSLGNEEPNPQMGAILILNENPADGATDVYTNPGLSANVLDSSGQNMTVIFREKVLGIWTDIGTFVNVTDGKYAANATGMKYLGSTYYWGVCVTDGSIWMNETFSLTTTTKVLNLKWVNQSLPQGASGVLIGDINEDGKQEIIHAGLGGIVALDGTTGNVMWRLNDGGIGNFAQPQMADLNKDGILDIVIPREGNSLQAGTQAGLLILRGNDHTVLWNVTGLGRETYSGPVIADVDGSGYPTIFFCSTDVYNGPNGTGKLTSIRYDPAKQNFTILLSTTVWRPCGGGLSLADIDGSGQFRLFIGDRYMYLNDSEYGDNDYGKGVQSYWARNLSLIWSRPDIFCSSQKPMLADVDSNGKLEVIIGDMNGGVYVLNASDGSTIRSYVPGSGTVPTHYQPSIFDIDGDGHLEFLCADSHHDINDPTNPLTSEDIVIVDLVTMQAKKNMYIGKCFYGPQEADVTGDGVPDIIACNYEGVAIFDKTGRGIDSLTGFTGIFNYAVAQDIDGDGYTELVVSSQAGVVYAFDTPARAPIQRSRTEIEFYSEYRRGVAEYVQPLVSQRPLVFYAYPANPSQDVPVSLSALQFTLTDYQYNPMSYTVTTYPNIGGDSKSNVGNGPYTVAVTGLAPSTTYTWVINVTDGTNWTNATYTFTTQPILPWSKTGWNYRKSITIDHSQISADLQNFPVLINITSPDLSKAQTNGNDIMFADSDGNQLNHEIEFFNQTSGYLVAWVKVQNISSKADTVLYMYYGNPGATNQQNATGVWDSNFVMVQHMREPSGTRYDSTSNGNNAAVNDGVNKDPSGKIDGADAFAGKGAEKVPAGFLPNGSITVELWFKPSLYSTTSWTKFINTGPTTTRGIFGSQTSLNSTAYSWTMGFSWNSGAISLNSYDIISNNVWKHVVLTWSGQLFTAYVNGVIVRQANVTGVPDWAGLPLYLGANLNMQENFTGSMDEVRISNVARTPAWIQACFRNQNNAFAFCAIGNEETVPGQPVVFAPAPPDKTKNVSLSLSGLSFNITDYQNEAMDYSVTSYPNIGSGAGTNVGSGMFTIPVSNLQNFTTYQWNVSVTDGTLWTNITYTFSTLPDPPTQGSPNLTLDGTGNLICSNLTTSDPQGNSVTNMYHWFKNDTSTTNLLMPFDTNSTTAKDYSGFNNNGAIVGNVAWTRNGKVGGAYNFNGGYITIAGTSTLDGGGNWQEITVEEWIYLTATQSNTRTIARLPSYEIGISGNRLFGGIWIAGSPMISGYNRVVSNTTLQINTWYHVALTYRSGTGLTLYINGMPDTNLTSVSGNIQASGYNPLYIGWFEYFKGMIDEVQIYPKCLSSQQILRTYQETKDGLSNSSTMVSAETNVGDTWRCEVTPTNSYQDGLTRSSNPVTIVSKAMSLIIMDYSKAQIAVPILLLGRQDP